MHTYIHAHKCVYVYTETFMLYITVTATEKNLIKEKKKCHYDGGQIQDKKQ